MTYILEGDNETKRLDLQSNIKAYSLEDELTAERLPRPGDQVVEVGCGHGTVSRYMASNVKNIKIHAFDISDDRLEKARQLSENLPIKYEVGNAASLPVEESSVDYVLCRYVYEYFPNPLKTTLEFKRILKNNGRLVIVVFDGAFFNLQTIDEEFNKELIEVHKLISPIVNCYIGREVPVLVQQSGLRIDHISTQAYDFFSIDRELEWENSRQRLELSAPILSEHMGKGRYEEFKNKYLYHLNEKTSFMFYNKFIIEAQKI